MMSLRQRIAERLSPIKEPQVYTYVYCTMCNQPVEMIDVVREHGNNYHKECLKDAKGSCLCPGDYEPDIS